MERALRGRLAAARLGRRGAFQAACAERGESSNGTPIMPRHLSPGARARRWRRWRLLLTALRRPGDGGEAMVSRWPAAVASGWHPVAFSAAVGARPVAARLMGRRLVVARDGEGAVRPRRPLPASRRAAVARPGRGRSASSAPITAGGSDGAAIASRCPASRCRGAPARALPCIDRAGLVWTSLAAEPGPFPQLPDALEDEYARPLLVAAAGEPGGPARRDREPSRPGPSAPRPSLDGAVAEPAPAGRGVGPVGAVGRRGRLSRRLDAGGADAPAARGQEGAQHRPPLSADHRRGRLRGRARAQALGRGGVRAGGRRA